MCLRILILTAITSYIIGAIPFGWLVAKLKGIDITEYGSGKIGFTNVLRTLGKRTAYPILFLDILKGVVVVLLADWGANKCSEWVFFKSLVVIALFIGHSWSPILRVSTGKWHGGRSVAAGLGVMLLICWYCMAVSLLGLLFTVRTRLMSLGVLVSITLAWCMATLFTVLGYLPLTDLFVVLTGALFLYLRHIASIKRLLSGRELRI